MPELPEVETIKEDLRGLVVGSTLEWAEVLAPSLVEQPSTEEFVGRLEGVGITGARRRAKHLIVELDSGDSLVFQLKIGGQLLLVPPVEEPLTALMLVLHLDGDRRLFLRDETGLHAGASARRRGARGAALLFRAGAARRRVRDGLSAACHRFAQGPDKAPAPGSEGRLGNRQHLRR